MKSPALPWIVGILLSIIVSTVFLFSTGLVSFSRALYSPSLVYRYQTYSFAQGSLSLYEDPSNLTYDYVYYNGEVQHVWGLGVPLLRMPFELLMKGIFPDRITLGIYLAAMVMAIFSTLMWYISRALPKLSSLKTMLLACALSLSTMGIVSFVSLARTRFIVYEEAVFYGVIVSFILLCAAVRTRSVFWAYVISFLAGASGLVRPTVLAYGVATVAVLLYRFKTTKKQAGGFLIAFICGLLLLGATNYVRFGSFVEFGHGINIDRDALNNHQLKFNYQFAHAPLIPAAKELIGGLFFTDPPAQRSVYAPNMVAFQAPILRWRSFYSNTFSVFHFGILLITLGILCAYSYYLIRYRKLKGFFLSEGTLLLLGWAGISFSLLFVFYLHSPSLSSRYMVDFTGALGTMTFTLCVAGISFFLQRRHQKIRQIGSISLVILVLVVTGYCLFRIWQTPATSAKALTKNQVLTSLYKISGHSIILGQSYTLGKERKRYGNYNGTGWDAITGEASSTVLFFMQHLQNIDMTLVGTCQKITDQAIEMKIGNDYLKPTITHVSTTTLVHFDIPNRYKSDTIWPVYIKIFDTETSSTSEKGCALTKVIWQDD